MSQGLREDFDGIIAVLYYHFTSNDHFVFVIGVVLICYYLF